MEDCVYHHGESLLVSVFNFKTSFDNNEHVSCVLNVAIAQREDTYLI